MNVLVWFRRDLRIADHPALALAASLGRVLPLWVADPDEWRQPEASGRHWALLAEALAGLRADLGALGAPLVVRSGDPAAVIPRLARTWHIDRVISLPGSGSSHDRGVEVRLAAGLSAAGIRWDRLAPVAPAGLVEGEGPPDPVSLVPVAGLEPGLIPGARAMGLAEDPCPHRPPGGRLAAEVLLQGAMGRGESRLSPHLALGVLSPLQLARLPDQGERRALLPGLDRRAAAHHVMRSRPGGDLQRWTGADTGDRAHLAAFAAGETGLPFVDANLRALRASGWLDARGRALLAGTALDLLGLEWRAVGQVLARLSCDHDPGILWPAMQAQGRAGGAPLVDPLRQGQLADPDGVFLRRWLPELAVVPDAYLHQPWRWPGAARVLGRRYPEPLIDPASARRAARDLAAPARLLRAPRPPVQAAHSRLDQVLIWPEPGRAPPQPPGGQLCLDL